MKKQVAFLLSLFLSLPACRQLAEAPGAAIHPIKQDFTHVIHTEGQVKPVIMETLNIPQRMWGTLETLLPEGARVKEGEVVASVSTRSFMERISHYAERFELEQAQLRESQASMPLERLKIQSDIAEKERQAQQQKLDLQTVIAGPRLDERVNTRVKKEVADLKARNFPLEQKEQLYGQGYVSQAEVQQARQELLGYQTDRETANLTLKQQSRDYRKPDIEQAELKNQAVDLETRIAQLSGQAQESLLKTKNQNQTSRMQAYQRRYDSFQQRIAGAVLKAPFDGTVLYPKLWGNQRPYIGMEVWSGLSVIEVARTDQLLVRSRVDEFSIPHVHEGQKVSMTNPGFPGRVFTGTVAKIQKLAKYKDETKPVGLKYFDIDIALDGFGPLPQEALKDETPTAKPKRAQRHRPRNGNGQRPPGAWKKHKKSHSKPSSTENSPAPEAALLKANMSVDVAIQVQTLSHVWTVPLEALVDKGEKSFLRLREKGKVLEREVDVLDRSDNLAALKGDFTGHEELVLGGSS